MDIRKALLPAVMGASMIGGALGATALSAIANADTPSPSPAIPGAPGAAPATQPAGVFKSNEDPAHEAGESAEREAQEDAGQRPTVK